MNLKKVFLVFAGFLLLIALASSNEISDGSLVPAVGEIDEIGFSKHSVPPNEDAIIQMLIEKGMVGRNATEKELREALTKYLQKKLVVNQRTKQQDKALLLREIRRTKQRGLTAERDGELNFDKLIKDLDDDLFDDDFEEEDDDDFDDEDDDNYIRGVRERVWTGEVKKEKLLVLLADFSDDEYGIGPLHNQIPKPPAEDNGSLWVSDFSAEHYKKMLFTKGGYDAIDQNGNILHLDSMVDYYLEQSGGSLEVDGEVFGWFTLPHSEAYYGDDNPSGGIDNMPPGSPKDLVRELVIAANNYGVPFQDFDLKDPYDLDSDGNLEEPDGIIDHLVIVHAGIDQSGGGGAQGDNAIWAHSSSVWELIPVENPPVDYWDGNMVAYNYIIQGEDGGIGVFTHEFGHDLGLPDEYDTKYSGQGEPVGFYSLMSSGSWTGKPLGTKPAPMSPWGRIQLRSLHGGQWVEPTEINYEDIPYWGKWYKLDQTTSVGYNHQAIKINLPQHKMYLTAPYDGQFEWYSGKGDLIDYTLRTTIDLPSAANITLSFWTFYKIEVYWDFGFVQVSVDGGNTWTSLETERTTDIIEPGGHPDIVPHLPGYTGDSNGWVNEVIDLSQYAGQQIMLQYRYMTDWATTEEGFYVDKIEVTADGAVVFYDDAESGSSKWQVSGWRLFEGFEWKDHYYLLEWRTHNNTDEALKYCYSFKNRATNEMEFFKSERGLLVWYRDTAHTDNWVGIHPGEVFLGIVDSHPEPILYYDGNAIRTRLQMHDASFGLYPIRPKLFYVNELPFTTYWERPIRLFSDDKTYWYPEAPSSGIKITEYGLKFGVMAASYDYTVGLIWVKRSYSH